MRTLVQPVISEAAKFSMAEMQVCLDYRFPPKRPPARTLAALFPQLRPAESVCQG
jgi:hypothetical protein